MDIIVTAPLTSVSVTLGDRGMGIGFIMVDDAMRMKLNSMRMNATVRKMKKYLVRAGLDPRDGFCASTLLPESSLDRKLERGKYSVSIKVTEGITE